MLCIPPASTISGNLKETIGPEGAATACCIRVDKAKTPVESLRKDIMGKRRGRKCTAASTWAATYQYIYSSQTLTRISRVSPNINNPAVSTTQPAYSGWDCGPTGHGCGVELRRAEYYNIDTSLYLITPQLRVGRRSVYSRIQVFRMVPSTRLTTSATFPAER
jgi:hypothetical protein